MRRALTFGLVLALGISASSVGRTAVAHAELHHTVATKQPRAKLSEFLVAPAKRAAKARDYVKAIPLYRALVVARGPGSPEAKTLATLWTAAGQNEQAAEAWADYAAATNDAAAKSEAERLAALRDPFADKLVLAPITVEANRAVALGRKALAAKQYGDALVYFHIGYALAPDLPDFVRELGTTYQKLDAGDARRDFFLAYLRARPIGGNADLVRKQLAADPVAKSQLGTLVVSASLPCTELWLNRQRVAKIPDKGIVVAPGSYKGLCFNAKLEMALFEYATVDPGKPAAMTFRWAIVENRLVKPFGRIALENPKSPGTLVDLGITSTEVGVAAPADGRKLKMVLLDDTGTRREERSVEVVPGQRLVVQW